MRLFVLITLMVSIALSPAAALASCASMADHILAAADGAVADRGGMNMADMAGEDCGGMADKSSQTHDAGCVAACALVCPGFYVGSDGPVASAPVLVFAKHATPAMVPGAATPSHLDPPPPRA